MANVLQLNLNHCQVAQDLLPRLAQEEKADVLIISEQYQDRRESNWISDASGKAAIWVRGDLHITKKMATPAACFTWVEVAGMRIYSCYHPPSDSIDEFLSSVDAIVASARTAQLPVVIGGDFNAWAEEWGSVKTNQRGKSLLEAFAILELEIANSGSKPTFNRGGKSSIIDLTFVDAKLAGNGIHWRVSDRYTGSDHQALVYQLQVSRRASDTTGPTMSRRWAPATFDRDTFLCTLKRVRCEGTAGEKAQDLTQAIIAACDASMVKKVNARGRPPIYWWNEDIAIIRRECLRARRLHQRAVGGPRFQELSATYAQKRKQLKTAIKAAKRTCWRDFCEEVEQDPWGRPYKTVMNKIKRRGGSVPTCSVFLNRVVHHLFPAHQERPAGTGLSGDDSTDELPNVTEAEIIVAAKRICIRKAPGPDKIPGLAIKTAALNIPGIFAATFSACLREGTFPSHWKVQRLVLIPKDGKPSDEPSSYRPLCMLDIVGKLLERVIYTRLEAAIQQVGDLSDSQFGFRKGRSTIDAIERVVKIASGAIKGSRCTKRMCAIIALDVRNAFNSARWYNIMIALENLRVPLYLRRIVSSYLTDRTLLYNTDNGTHSYNITGGVPQGSVVGSLIWNSLYDGLLRQPLPDGVSMVAYADDVALLVVAKTIDEVQHKGDAAIEVVAGWLRHNGLSLAAEKTEALLIARTKKRKYATFTVQNRKIKTADTLKYLGVTLDARLSFKEHLSRAGLKASKVARALAGIMPNIGGPKQPRRSLLSSVVISVILYGAPIWADALSSNESYGITCQRACRLAALRVARAYSTVSSIALSVITGIPPIDLIAAERARRYREGERSAESDDNLEQSHIRWSQRTNKEWQRRWESTDKGRWTHRIIPEVGDWTSRKHGLVSFHLTQILTGHGCFRSYLKRIGVYQTADCPACPGCDEDVNHVLFHCPRFEEERERFQATWESPLSPEGIGRCLLDSQGGWDAVTGLATSIVEKLSSIRRREERREVSDRRSR